DNPSARSAKEAKIICRKSAGARRVMLFFVRAAHGSRAFRAKSTPKPYFSEPNMVNLMRKYQQTLLLIITILVIIAFAWLYNDYKLGGRGHEDRVGMVY